MTRILLLGIHGSRIFIPNQTAHTHTDTLTYLYVYTYNNINGVYAALEYSHTQICLMCVWVQILPYFSSFYTLSASLPYYANTSILILLAEIFSSHSFPYYHSVFPGRKNFSAIISRYKVKREKKIIRIKFDHLQPQT